MKRLFKHILSMILVLTLIIGAIPFSSLTAVKAEPTEGTNYFNVSADLIDYYNDNRINGGTSTDNQGVQTGAYSPYGKLNQWISGLSSYAGTGSLIESKNLIKNGGFETGDFTDWTTWKPDDQTYVSCGVDNNDAYEGSHKCYFYNGSAYRQSIHQEVTGLADGTYLVTAWVKVSNNAPATCRMELGKYDNNDVNASTFIDIPFNQAYKQYVGMAKVTSGKLDVGFYCESSNGTSMQIDSVELYKVNNNNLITNGDFETGNFTGWTTWRPDTQTFDACGVNGGNPYSGGYNCFFYSDQSYEHSIHQVITVENGLYLVTAYVKARGTTPEACQMELNGNATAINKISDSISEYQEPEYYQQIFNIVEVKNRTIDVGFYCKSPGNTSLQIDNVELYKVDNGSNLITNGGFETGDLTGWTTWNSAGTDVCGVNDGDPYSGSKNCYFYSGNSYEQSIHQEVTVENGLYLVTAYVKARGKKPDICQMQLQYGNPINIDIIDSDIGAFQGSEYYQQISNTVKVTNGSIDIGFYCKSSEGGTSLQIDNVELYKIDATAEEINSKPVPLYFGDLSNRKQAGNGNLNWYWQAANVCILGDDIPGGITHIYNVSAKGLVADHLSADGKLLSSYNDAPMPLFEENSYPDQSTYMRFYHNLQFPFTITTDANGVTKYSFNSKENTVYYDEATNSLVRDDSIHIYDWSEDHSEAQGIGFFPFNKVSPTSTDDANKLNFGFGTKFTIPFTVSEDGKDKSGNDITFNFSGDDDVWVFIDGALVLDMGGGHNEAQGNINFATQTATVTTGTIDARTGYQSVFSGGNYYSVNSEITIPDTVSFSDITVNTAGGNKPLSAYIKESGQIHTLTMYYMERGMYNSNMSIDFSFNPMPSGLSITKDVDVANVNTGLKTAVATKDTFDFTVSDNNNTEPEYSYKKINTASGEETAVTTSGKKITGLSDNIYAKDLTYASGNSLTSGTKITVVENENANYTTKWVASDVSNNSKISEGDGKTATFQLGEESLTTSSYNLNFVNTPKVGSVTAKKVWNGDIPETLQNTEFDFKAEVDLDGDGNGYQAYALAYTKGGVNGTTGQDGSFKIKVGETVTFDGIPVGAKVRVTETTTSGHAWESSTSTGEATVSEGTQTVTITNKTKNETVNKVIYVEAGRETSYKVADGEYEIKIPTDKVSITEASTKKDASLTADGTSTVKVKGSSSDQKYVFSYTGQDTGGRNVNGTITVYTYNAMNKIYVFDYGLKSDLTVTNENQDGLFQGGVFYNTNVTGTTATLGSITAGTENGQTSITADPAVTINSDGSSTGHVYFEPEGFMDAVETYTYTANITQNGTTLNAENPETGTVVNGTIKVSPASTVYYEDNFNSDGANDSSVKIIYTGDTKQAGTPDLSMTQSNDQSEEYGHDDAYETGKTGNSAGSSTEMKAGATARFKFSGTGFDIISRTNDETANISVKVVDTNTNKTVARRLVDTYYSNGDLYQIPIISIMLENYSTYEVTITAMQATAVSKDKYGNATVDPDGTKRTVVYIDGIRIYNPLGVSEGSDITDTDGDNRDDATGYQEEEYGAKIKEIRNMILGTDGKGKDGTVALVMPKLSDDSCGNYDVISQGGCTTIENLGVPNSEEDASQPVSVNLADYLKKGPNNEVYLAYGEAIAFVVTTEAGQTPELQIEAKALKDTANDTVSFAVLNLDGSEEDETGNYSVPVNSNTAMYYKIPLNEAIELNDGSYLVVLMAGNGSIEGEEENIPMLSLTNLKYKNCSIVMPDESVFVNTTYHISTMSMMAATAVRLAVAPETVFRYTDEIAVTGLSTKSLNAKKGAKTNAVIKTTGETEGIVILDQNMEEIKLTSCKKTSSKGGVTNFNVSFVASKTKGTYLYTVYAVNADGYYSDKGTTIRVVVK